MKDDRNRVGYGMIRDGLATVSEVANLLGTSRQRVDHWCRFGLNPGRQGIDAKALRKQWLADTFEHKLAAAIKRKRKAKR